MDEIMNDPTNGNTGKQKPIFVTLTGLPLYTLKGYVERERIAVPLPNGELLTVVHMNKSL